MSRKQGRSPSSPPTGYEQGGPKWLEIHKRGFESAIRAARDAWQLKHPDDTEDEIVQAILTVMRMNLESQRPPKTLSTQVFQSPPAAPSDPM